MTSTLQLLSFSSFPPSKRSSVEAVSRHLPGGLWSATEQEGLARGPRNPAKWADEIRIHMCIYIYRCMCNYIYICSCIICVRICICMTIYEIDFRCWYIMIYMMHMYNIYIYMISLISMIYMISYMIYIITIHCLKGGKGAMGIHSFSAYVRLKWGASWSYE